MRAAELGGANPVTNARSLAKLYGAMVAEVDGECLSAETVEAIRPSPCERAGACMGIEMTLGLGFMLSNASTPLLTDGSFGHRGTGGSLGFADPEASVGFGYVMNEMQSGPSGDPRPAALIDAIRHCISVR